MRGRDRRWGRLLSEFVVIVFGVLVALGVDEWRDTRLDGQIRDALLSGLVTDLVADSNDIAGFVGGSLYRMKWGEALIDVAGGREMDPDSLATAFRALGMSSRLEIVESTFEELVGSGASRTIPDPELRLMISSYYGLGRDRQDINDLLWPGMLRYREALTDRGYSYTDGTRIPVSVARDPEVAAIVRELTVWAGEAAQYTTDLTEANAELLERVRLHLRGQTF